MDLLYTNTSERLRTLALRDRLDVILETFFPGRDETVVAPLRNAIMTAIGESTVPSGVLVAPTKEEAAALGHEGALLVEWFASTLRALALLRTAPRGELALDRDTWNELINAVDNRLLVRLRGIRDALVRAACNPGAVVNGRGEEGAASIGELAMWMDVPPSTAQSRRDAIVHKPWSMWEFWARTDGPQDRPPAEEGLRCPYCQRRDILVKGGRWDCPRCERSGPVVPRVYGDENGKARPAASKGKGDGIEPYVPLGLTTEDHRAEFHRAKDAFAERYLAEHGTATGFSAAFEESEEFARLFPLAFPQQQR